MQQIIEKRSALLNHFFNQSIDYSKEEILAKEYAALSFSPREEYIDVFETGYEDVLTPTEELDVDMPEVLVKGIIVDVDMKKNYCIIHIQNKGDNLSVTVDSNVLKKYGDYLQKGHLILIKGHTYQGKIYMHFLIDYHTDDSFILESNYLNGTSEQIVNDIDDDMRLDTIGLVRQAKYFKSKKGNNCLRVQVYEKGAEKTYITCNGFDKNITAGMIISYNISDNPSFCNNLTEARL